MAAESVSTERYVRPRLTLDDLLMATYEPDHEYFARCIGEEAWQFLQSKGLTIYYETIDRCTVIPVDQWMLSFTPTLGNQLQLSFEFTADYIRRKNKEIGEDSLAVVNDALQPGTIAFMHFLKEFVSLVNGTKTIRIIADERRYPLYKQQLEKIDPEGKRIILIPKVITIDFDEPEVPAAPVPPQEPIKE